MKTHQLKQLTLCIAIILSLSACSQANKTDETAADDGLSYQCDNGQILNVQYINTQDSHSAIVTYQGQTFDMYETRAASGAKYATEQGLTPEDGLMWWSENNEGMLIQMILDHTVKAEDYPIIARCVKS